MMMVRMNRMESDLVEIGQNYEDINLTQVTQHCIEMVDIRVLVTWSIFMYYFVCTYYALEIPVLF